MTFTEAAPVPGQMPPEVSQPQAHPFIEGPKIVGTKDARVIEPGVAQPEIVQPTEAPVANQAVAEFDKLLPDNVEVTEKERTLARNVGRIVLGTGVIEVGGALLDAAMIGTGQAGVQVLKSAPFREAIASIADTLGYRKLLHRKEKPKPVETSEPVEATEQVEAKSRVRKIASGLGYTALGAGGALGSMYMAPHALHLVHLGFQHGFGREYAQPIGSNVLGVQGVNYASRRVVSRFKRSR